VVIEEGNEIIGGVIEDDIADNVEQELIDNDEEVLGVVGDEVGEIQQPNNLEDEMDERYGERSGRYDLRPRKARNYDHLHSQIADTTQYGLRTGLKMFGEAGSEAVLSELKQLHDRGVMEPRKGKELSFRERKNALKYLMFLKQKRCGKIKGRGCADGRPQRNYTTKEELSSPTVAI
jgi:hypothetical protein